MMMDQMLDLSLSLSNEVPMMHHMINGDGPQQVSLSSQTSYQQPLILNPEIFLQATATL